MMSLLSSTRCYFCEREATHTCKVCGRPVCERHYYSGICYACKLGLCQVCGERLSVGRCVICGRLICRECSVEYQPGIRVCKVCASKCKDLKDCVKRTRDVSNYLKIAKRIYEKIIEGVGSSSTSH